MTIGLPVSRLIDASVVLNPQAAATANINSLLIIGDSDVIDTQTRIVSYASLTEVSAAFGTSAPEYLAAVLWFGQTPKPNQLYIGKWARTATAGRLIGAARSAAQQAMSVWNAITTGALKYATDGAAAVQVTGLNFSACTTMTAVAAVINAAIAGGTCTWDGSHLVIKSSTTGATSAIALPVVPTVGVDIRAAAGFLAVDGARSVNGIAAETALAGLAAIDGLSTYFYGVMVAYSALADSDHQALAGYVEASTKPHLYGLTTSEATAIDGTSSADIGSLLKAAAYKRSFCQYSTSSPYAVASMFARILTTDFNAQNSTITLMYKVEPGVTAETLTGDQANVLDAKRYNYFVNFDNSTAIIVNGMCAGDAFIDEIVGLDWFASRVQGDVWNLLYTSATKIPQTDAGNQQIANTIEGSCDAAVNNGLFGPGTWTNTGFGQLKQNDFLPKGYYVFAPPLSAQSQADREARKSVTFQIAAKLAGAVHTVDLLIYVNR